MALVQTIDFFTPVVDDPYAFGQVAAANALSDVYAMGGRPLTALNVVGFPVSKLPREMLAEILRGGADKVHEAGAVLLGGHSIDDPEPKYGLAVTGTVHPGKFLAKAGARPGQDLILTKPIGVGSITTAIKRGLASEEVIAEVTRIMSTLNNVSDVLHEAGVRGCTDVTGFGLLGHASEMAGESGVEMVIHWGDVPVIPATFEFAAQNVFPGGTRKNQGYLARTVEYDPEITLEQQLILCDAITSGGLLISSPKESTEAILRHLKEKGAPAPAVIGETTAGPEGRIRVVP